MIVVLFLAKNSRTSIDVWAVVLSWCKIHDWFFHNSVCFRWIASHNRLITQGSIPYWSYDLVGRIHDAPCHCNLEKQWAKPSHLNCFFSISSFLDPRKFGIIGLWFQCHSHVPVIRHQLWIFEQIWIVVERRQNLLIDVVIAQNSAILKQSSLPHVSCLNHPYKLLGMSRRIWQHHQQPL